MKLLSKLFILAISIGCLQAQELNGAWKKVNEKSADQITIRLYSDAYFTTSTRIESTGEFVSASGGTYAINETDHIQNYEIHTTSRAITGTYLNYDYELKNDTLRLNDKNSRNEEVWVRIDAAEKENVTCWKIHQAFRDSEWKTIADKPRKSLKMLTDNYYQVLALNSQTGEFFGSSGGKWTFEDGKHKEMIRFFSKNPDMVGKTLPFDRSIKDGIWSHNGKSSEGEYIQERWKKFK